MTRLLKFIPVALTLVTRFLRSPQGQALVQRIRASLRRPKTAGTTRRRF